MKIKKRLDVLLQERGLAETRTKAQAIIMSGMVYFSGQKADKPGTSYEETAEIEVRGAACPYVSRGGLKLEKALREFCVDLGGKTVLDVGASTGGFTDCALRHGAERVYAVDVGYGQLDWKLRQDPRVVCLERKNARYLSFADIPEKVDVITIDVAFISLEKVLGPLSPFLNEKRLVLDLIKP